MVGGGGRGEVFGGSDGDPVKQKREEGHQDQSERTDVQRHA